jgi:hypothetical protein
MVNQEGNFDKEQDICVALKCFPAEKLPFAKTKLVTLQWRS